MYQQHFLYLELGVWTKRLTEGLTVGEKDKESEGEADGQADVRKYGHKKKNITTVLTM